MRISEKKKKQKQPSKNEGIKSEEVFLNKGGHLIVMK